MKRPRGRRPRQKPEHPIYTANGNEDARLDQLMTMDDTRFYQTALAMLSDRKRRSP